MKNKLLLSLLLLIYSLGYSQYTLIPDPNFEGYLVNVGIDTDGLVNGQVLTSDIADEIQLSISIGNQITDLTGIEDFESLEILGIDQMDITEINLTQNNNLKFLNLSEVSLETLDLTNNLNLISLFLNFNFDGAVFTSLMTSIDVSYNVLLKQIYIHNTLITEFDFINNISIEQLGLSKNENLININLKNEVNHDLGFVEIYDNPLLQCLQVDDPDAVIAGIIPPYNNWTFENNPLLTITDDCNLGLEEVAFTQITFYPNPIINVLKIDNSSDYPIKNIKVYNVLGSLVFEEDNPINQIDLSSLSKGVVFIKIETSNGLLVKKFIKK